MLCVVMLAANCKKDETTTTPTPPVTNYTITINNFTGDPTKQFTYMTLTPIEAGGQELSYNFVINPNENTTISLYLTNITFYKISVYLYKNGPSIWWDSIALEPNKNSRINIRNNNNNYILYSDINSLLPNGCNIQ